MLKGKAMRKFVMRCAAAAAMVVIGALLSSGVRAMTIAAPAGLNAVSDNAPPLTQEVANICRPAWRCYWGCGWWRTCAWTHGDAYGYYAPSRRSAWRH